LDIQKIKKLYDQNQNLTGYFKTTQNKDSLNSQEIELIYDLQSGIYSRNYENNKIHREYKDRFTDEIIEHINNLNFKFDSILEAGIGEGTTFVNVIQKLDIPKLKSFGLDISWSRLSYANKFLKKHSIKNTKLVTGLLENLPFLENSIDIVFTAHSIEPNGGKEKEILKELFRVTKNYLILLEPSYEFGNDEQKERMDKLSYARNLSKYCKELGYKIVKHELLKNHSVENNKTEIIIIEKSTKKTKTKDFLACPETKTKLFKNKNFYYSAESFYSYPILENIICLNSKNKILSTMLDKFITLNKNDPRYYEQIFFKSIEETINEEKIKNTYYPNCIGFLITKENLEDKIFCKFIYELSKTFPNNRIFAYGFNYNNKELLQKKFPLGNNIIFTILKNIKQITKDINTWIESASNPKGKLFSYLLYESENTLCFNIENNMNTSLKELSNTDRFKNHIFVKHPNFFHFENASDNLFEMLCNEMNITYNENMLYKDFLYKHIEFNLNDKEANKFYTQRVNKLRDFINNKIQIK
jgi:ubiquinone/menaquinone biosynthesis C-methylase UbiE